MNNIPKETNTYKNDPLDFAKVDNTLAAANMSIGESSNLAQIAQVYTYNYEDQKYKDYVCILSVLAQVAIDNAKRSFDIDLTKEIIRIRKDLDIEVNGYPKFWYFLQRKNRFAKKKDDAIEEEISEEMQEFLDSMDYNTPSTRRKVTKDKLKGLNPNLKCPMNYLCEVKFPEFKSRTSTLEMDYFFQQFPLEASRRKSRRVEEFITKYMYSLLDVEKDLTNISYYENDNLLLHDFDQLVKDIQTIYISNQYIGLTAWLLNRAFRITPAMRGSKDKIDSRISKNKSLLLKVLYTINKDNVLRCLSKNLENKNI